MTLTAAAAPARFACQGECRCNEQHQHLNRVVVTGGPGAGKTAVLEMASRTFCRHVAVVPEAASIAFGGGFPRTSTKTGRRAAQRAIFHIQRELETIVEAESRFALALCDRGTIDGVAYWPGSQTAFYAALGTSPQEELNRYSAVIHLRTPPVHRGYNNDNHLRTETAEEAALIDEKLELAWRPHPHRTIISSEDDFPTKAAQALEAIAALIPPCCAGEQ